ncbi:hypothetical protein RB595_001580 [Gaeumannomyces hyphopodioides]
MAPARDILRTANHPQKETGNVFIYIDNSNLWIQGQRTYSEKYKQKAHLDPRWRFDAGILKDVLLGQSGLSADEETFQPKIRLYGSTPPIVDSVWEAIEQHDIKVTTFERSSWTRREKEVDAELIADSVEEVCHAFYTDIPAVFIIVSGDRDVRAAVIKIVRKGFPVHIWAWRNGIASAFTKEDPDINPDLFKVHYLDPHLETMGLTRTTFRVDRSVINPHSIVVLDPMSKANEVENFLNQLRTPAYRYEIPDHRREGGSNDLAIIPAQASTMNPDELRSLFMESKAKLERKGLRVLSYLEYSQKHFLGGGGTESTLAVSNQFKELGGDVEERDKEAEEQEEDNGSDDHHSAKQDAAATGFPQTSYNGDGDDGFQEVNGWLKRQQGRLRKGDDSLRIRCNWRDYCERGLDCKFGHTKEERENFRVYGTKKAKKYKLCERDNCLFGARCQFAHGEAELFCPTCGKTGAHAMVSCPERSSSSPSARRNYSR